MNKSEPEQEKESRVRWTGKEWETLAMGLNLKFPERRLADSKSMKLSIDEFTQAMQALLPESRHRPVHNLHPFKIQLKQALDKLKPLIKADENNNAEVETVSAEPGAVAIADEPEQPGAVPGAISRRVFWDSDEWLQIGRELVRLNPSLIHSKTLVQIKMPDIQQAQKVLPEERRRTGVLNMAQTRDALKAPMKLIAEEVRLAEESRKAQEAEQAAAQAEANRNPYEKALMPLMQFMMAEAVKALQPVIERQIADAIAHALPQAIKGQAIDLPVKSHLPKKPRIGLCGASKETSARVAKDFPELDFVIAGEDAPNLVAAVQNCDRVIAMRWINHPDTWKLKKAVGDRFTQVHGGESEAKRYLNTLLNSGAIKVPQAQPGLH